MAGICCNWIDIKTFTLPYKTKKDNKWKKKPDEEGELKFQVASIIKFQIVFTTFPESNKVKWNM